MRAATSTQVKRVYRGADSSARRSVAGYPRFTQGASSFDCEPGDQERKQTDPQPARSCRVTQRNGHQRITHNRERGPGARGCTALQCTELGFAKGVANRLDESGLVIA